MNDNIKRRNAFLKGMPPQPPAGGRVKTGHVSARYVYRDNKIYVDYTLSLEYDAPKDKLRGLVAAFMRNGIEVGGISNLDLQRQGSGLPGVDRGNGYAQVDRDQYRQQLSKARAALAKAPALDKNAPDWQRVVDVQTRYGQINLSIPQAGTVILKYRDPALLLINGLRRKGYKVNRRADNAARQDGFSKPKPEGRE